MAINKTRIKKQILGIQNPTSDEEIKLAIDNLVKNLEDE
jgi:hypothetical protein